MHFDSALCSEVRCVVAFDVPSGGTPACHVRSGAMRKDMLELNPVRITTNSATLAWMRLHQGANIECHAVIR